MPEWCECKNPRDSVTAGGVERCCQCGLPIKFDPSEYANPAMRRSTEDQMEWDVFNGWLFNALTEAGIEITNGPKLFHATEILFRKVSDAGSTEGFLRPPSSSSAAAQKAEGA